MTDGTQVLTPPRGGGMAAARGKALVPARPLACGWRSQSRGRGEGGSRRRSGLEASKFPSLAYRELLLGKWESGTEDVEFAPKKI